MPPQYRLGLVANVGLRLAARPWMSMIANWRCSRCGSSFKSVAKTSSGAWPASNRSSARSPQIGSCQCCVQNAPTPGRTYGTTRPTAGNLLATACAANSGFRIDRHNRERGGDSVRREVGRSGRRRNGLLDFTACYGDTEREQDQQLFSHGGTRVRSRLRIVRIVEIVMQNSVA